MAKASKNEPQEGVAISIAAPNIKTGVFRIRGTAPYVQGKFNEDALNTMKAKQQAGSTAQKGAKRSAKDFQRCFEQSYRQTKEGWYGIPTSAIRNAMIDACRLVGFKMTHMKQAINVIPHGFDKDDGMSLVKVTKGKPRYCEHAVKNATGVADIRVRAMYDPGWEADVAISFDADVFTIADVGNLLSRAGAQVGIGHGRPASPKSGGMGWGTFEFAGAK